MGQRTETAAEFEGIEASNRAEFNRFRKRRILMRSSLLWKGQRHYVVERADDGWWRVRRIRRHRSETRRWLSRYICNATEDQLDARQTGDNLGWYERREDALARLEPKPKRRKR